MKKLKYIGILFLLILFSCVDDESDTEISISMRLKLRGSKIIRRSKWEGN